MILYENDCVVFFYKCERLRLNIEYMYTSYSYMQLPLFYNNILIFLDFVFYFLGIF